MLNLKQFEKKQKKKRASTRPTDSNFSQDEVDSICKELNLSTKAYKKFLVNKKDAIKHAQENAIKIGKKDRDLWYKSRGFTHMFPFTDKELKELKLYFTHLDEDMGGSIGIEELETPLISLGIASSREEVQNIVESCDDDGEIDFGEFLNILSNDDKTDQEAGLVKFFKDLSSGELDGFKSGAQNHLSFNNIISTVRRAKIIDAYGYKKDSTRKKKKVGFQILTSFEKLRNLQQKEEEAIHIFDDQEKLELQMQYEMNKAENELDDFLLSDDND